MPAREAAMLAAAVLLLAANDQASAEIFRCTSPGAPVSYQEFPCPPSTQAVTMPIGDFPAVNMLERDRLMQRDAALDARILKRAEIDASERIARDDRIARELTLQAQMERERAEAASYYVLGRPFIGRGRGVARHPWPSAIR